MDHNQLEAVPPDPIPLDSILSEPLTHPLNLAPPAPRVPAAPPPLPPRDQASAGTVWRDGLLDFFGAIAVTLVAAVLVIAVVGVEIPPAGYAALFIATQIPLFVFARRRLKRNRQKGRRMPALFAGDAGPAIAWGVGAGFALALTSGIYTAVLQRLIGDEAIPQQLDILRNVAGNPWMMAVFVLIVAVMAPICEEMLFRGAMFASAEAVGQVGAGAGVSAVLFSLAHLSLNLMPFYMLFALVMCWLYSRTRTLFAPMAAHFTMNALACIALIAQGPSEVV